MNGFFVSIWRTRSRRPARLAPDGPLLGLRPATRALRDARRDSLLTVGSCLAMTIVGSVGSPSGRAVQTAERLLQADRSGRGYRQSSRRAAPEPRRGCAASARWDTII